MNYLKRLILISLFLSSMVWAINLSYLENSNINQLETTYQFIERAKAEKRETSSSFYLTESSNVRCVGRWPFGESDNIRPSDHFASDSIVFLASGSGIRILKLSNPALPRMIGQINCNGILSGWMGGGEGIVCKDSIVYALSTSDLWNGMQIFDIHNPIQPQELGNLAFSGWTRDIAVKDTFAYTVGYDSFFRVINISNLSNPYQVTSLMLPDYGLGIAVQGNYAYVAAWHAGLRAIDISNPGNPQQLSSVGGFSGIHVVADGDFAYVAGGAGGLRIINIINPDSMYDVGNLPSTPGTDIWKIGMFAYMISTESYNTNFWVIDVGDPSQPSRVSYATMSGWARAVWVLSPFTYGYTASTWEGLYVVDLHDPVNPVVDTSLFKAYSSNDIVVQGDYAYIANSFSGLKIIYISNPTMPYDVGSYDTTGTLPECLSATVKDSFAYVPWVSGLSPFRSIDVSDPSNPRLASVTGDTLFRVGDMIAKDSFVYVAAENRFQVFNVANPRQPRLVGSCNLPTVSSGLCIQDTFAYISPRLQIINISNPANPRLISTTPSNSWGIAVRDTFAFVSHAYDSLLVYSVANPLSPYEIGWAPLHGQGYDVVLRDSFAYVGCNDFRVFNITDPTHPQLVGYYTTPDRVRRVFADSEYVYVACFSAGVCIFEYVSPGIEEKIIERREAPDFSIVPNPVGPRCYLNLKGIANGPILMKVYNITG